MKKLLTLIALFGVLAVACNNSSNDPGLNVPSGPSIAKIDEQMASIEASLPKLQKSVDEAKALVAEPMSVTRGDDNNGVKTMIEALEERIAALEEYIASGGEGSWMDTTYATLDMYEETIALLAELQAEIDALKGQNDAQYEDVLESIEESVDSMKSWVNELLTGYYDIATIDAMFAKLLEGLSADDAAIRSEIEALRKELDKQFDDMEDAYRDAIREAIEENNGKLSEQLTKEIEAVNSRIDDEVEKLNKRLDDIEERLSQLEDSVSDLLKRIQSITYIPIYDDNTARVLCPNEGLEGSTVQLNFTISPRDAAEDLAAVWQEAISVKALYTGSPVMTDLPVVNCTAYADQGLLSVVAACDNLSWKFYNEDVKARAIMYISDGNNDLTSEYIPIIPQRSQILNNQIWYTVTGKTPVDIQQGSGPKIVSNTFDPSNEVYVVTFEETIYSIPADYFGGKSELKSVVLPNSVSLIADYAFSGCYSLSDISLGMSLSYIGSRVFEGCAIRTLSIPASLRHVNPDAFAGSSIAQFTGDMVADDGISLILDNTLVAFAPAGIGTEYSVPAEAESIGKGVFRDFSGVKQITIHDKVLSIDTEAFKNCDSLTSIAIPDSVKSIGSGAFTGCNNLNTITIGTGLTEIVSGLFSNLNNLKNITIGSGVTKIGDNAFQNCGSLTSFAIPDSVESIGSGAFSGCKNLNTITIGAGLTEIVSGLFSNLNNLENITIGSRVTKIGDNAFQNCGSLTSIAIPDSVESIGSGAFTGCGSIEQFSGKFATEDGYALVSNGTLIAFAKACGLQEYTISANITHIEERVFANCTNISLFRFESTIPPTLGANVFAGIDNLQISIPKEAVEAYLTCDWPYDYRRAIIELADINNIPDNCRLYYTTYDNQKLGVYTVDGRTVLSHNYTDGVGMVVFFEPLTTIRDDAFRFCNSLTSVTIPDSVTTIGDRAFFYCSSLASVNIPDSVTEIGYEAFVYCESLTSVTIPDSVTKIGDYAFDACYSLTSVTIGNSVTTIGDYAFTHCESLTSVTIPDSVTTIGVQAFGVCSSLTSVTIPDSVTTIGKSAFVNCESLTSVTIPDSVTTIGEWAFYDCRSLTSVTIGDSVTTIGYEAFCNCKSLTSVYCKATTPPAGNYNMFSYNASGRKIYVPTESVEAYKSASGWSDYASDIVGYDF
ncbi:MAG: leucine-rich repeat protein [Alistipes sp.]|nr:leucine-rich repeat protein [Alistipes sp.]